MLVEKAYVGITPEKPQQFVNNGLQVAFFGRDERKTFTQIKPDLVAKYGKRPRTGAVGFFMSMFKDMLHEFEILAHRDPVQVLPRSRKEKWPILTAPSYPLS